jgi:hypothetical protein
MLQQYAPAMRFMADYTMYYETTSKHLAEVRRFHDMLPVWLQ